MVDRMSAEDMPGNMTDGFHLVVEALKLNGVDTIYGVAGIPITDLLRLAQAEGIRYLGFRHEQSAGNAAAIAGYLTQKPGICMTVSAPGFLNGMVALANATTNCFPMILISGSSDRSIVDLEQGDYEELDQLNAARPYAKAAYRINRPQDIGIGIARAIIRNAPVLILDEPTSGLDAASEAIVFDALQRLMKGRTCIVITHRLPTIRAADVIFVLKDGRIEDYGTHSELLSRAGLYAHLYEKQFRTTDASH